MLLFILFGQIILTKLSFRRYIENISPEIVDVDNANDEDELEGDEDEIEDGASSFTPIHSHGAGFLLNCKDWQHLFLIYEYKDIDSRDNRYVVAVIYQVECMSMQVRSKLRS